MGKAAGVATACLVVDRGQIALFTTTIFKHAPASTFLPLSTFYDKGERRDGVPWRVEWLACDVARVIERAAVRAQMSADHPARVVFAPPLATFVTPDKATAANLAAAFAISVECDADAPQSVARLTSIIGMPTMVVASGGINIDPQTGAITDRLHAHWRLSKPATTATDLVLARRLACALAGSDATSINPVHPMRWAGSWHRKAAPRIARIVEMHDVEVDLHDALKKLTKAAIDCGAARYSDDESPVGGNPEKMASIEDVANWMRVIPNSLPEATWEWWNRIGMALWAATGGSAEGLALFQKWSAKAYDRPATVAARWRHYAKYPPTSLGAGTLCYIYTEHWTDNLDVAGDGGDET